MALWEMPEKEGTALQVIEVLKQASSQEPDNEEIAKMLVFAMKEHELDISVPVLDEKQRFDALFDWMKDGGADFEKLKLRYYAPDYRGVHAAKDIKKGETIVYVPLSEIITLEMAMESPIGAQMAEKKLRQRLISPKHSFLATYIMQERRKESHYDKYIDILPKAFDNFPIFYT